MFAEYAWLILKWGAISYMALGLVVMPIIAVGEERRRRSCSLSQAIWEAYPVAAWHMATELFGGQIWAIGFGLLVTLIVFVIMHLFGWLPMLLLDQPRRR